MRVFIVMSLAFFVSTAPAPVATSDDRVDIGPSIEKIRAVGPMAKGHRDAMPAWQTLARADMDQLTEVLAGMDGAGELAINWLRSAVETITQRRMEAGEPLPVTQLDRFLADTNHEPRARRLAYELICRFDERAEQRLVPSLLADPSMEMRRDAVAWVLDKAASLAGDGQRQAAIESYRRAFSAARDLDQIRATREKLREFGVEVSLPDHFGFVLRWRLIGPFDNTDAGGFDVAYPPQREINWNATYDGKVGKVTWFPHVTRDEYGVVDLNEVFGRPKKPDGSSFADSPEALRKYKGVVAYACADFSVGEQREVEIRLGSFNGHKVWLNGELIMTNSAFHAAMTVDQYVGEGRLRKGRNTILVKVAQNEWPDRWAQNWRFQLRVCDQYGTAVLSENRDEG